MRVLIGRPRCILIMAPHADDETIGAHGLMTRAQRSGIMVRVVVVTDGAASHPASVKWPSERLVRERQRETRRGMRRLGIAANRLTFLGLRDGALGESTAADRRRIMRVIRRAPKPLLVVAPALSDDHPDHRVVAAAVGATRAAQVRYLAYPVWPAGMRLRGARLLHLTAQERLAKRHAIRRYFTQVGMIRDDPSGFAMTRTQIAAFSRPAETFIERRR